jgi:hypothetical protein
VRARARASCLVGAACICNPSAAPQKPHDAPPLVTPPPPHPAIQVIAQLELWNERKSGRYEKKVYVLPKHLDEKVAALHLPKLGAKLTRLTPEQAAYINVAADGPYKPPAYRY